jgi:hypothetical protein
MRPKAMRMKHPSKPPPPRVGTAQFPARHITGRVLVVDLQVKIGRTIMRIDPITCSDSQDFNETNLRSA